MKKLRPFLALILACWLLALPALAEDEVDGTPDDASSVSDDVSGNTAPSEDSALPPDNETPASPEAFPAPSEDEPPEADASPPANDAPLTPDDAPPVSDNSAFAPEDTPSAEDPAPVDTPTETPVDPVPSETTTDPPISDIPVSDGSTAAQDPLPVYPIPDTSVVVPAPQEVPTDVYDTITSDTSTVGAPQVFTITTIPEFALAAIEPDADNTISQAIRDLFGTYTPRVQTVTTYYNGEQIAIEEQYVPGAAGIDWEWLAGVGVFCLILYCLFRLLGGTVKYG